MRTERSTAPPSTDTKLTNPYVSHRNSGTREVPAIHFATLDSTLVQLLFTNPFSSPIPTTASLKIYLKTYFFRPRVSPPLFFIQVSFFLVRRFLLHPNVPFLILLIVSVCSTSIRDTGSRIRSCGKFVQGSSVGKLPQANILVNCLSPADCIWLRSHPLIGLVLLKGRLPIRRKFLVSARRGLPPLLVSVCSAPHRTC